MKKIFIFISLIAFFTSTCLFSASNIPSPSSPKSHIKQPFTPGKALEEFEKHHEETIHRFIKEKKKVSLNDNPRTDLIYLLGQQKQKQLVLDDEIFEDMYSSLFKIAGAQDVHYVEHHYPDIIQVLKENYKNFDPTFTRVSTEIRLADDLSQQRRPLTSQQKIIVFGAIEPEFYHHPESLYRVNITNGYEYKRISDPDLLADMSSITQLAHIPDQTFEKAYVENVPGTAYYNPFFFRNAYRILKDDGELIMNLFSYMGEEPYNISNFHAYFEKNGFKIESIGACSFPKKRNSESARCVYLKKILTK